MFFYKGVCFRPIEKEDLENVRRLRNDPSTWLYLTSIGMISKADQDVWFAKMQSARDKAYFAVFEGQEEFPLQMSGDFLGIIRCDEMDTDNKSIRIGADIVPDKRGKGWGTKVFDAILWFCFAEMNMHRVWLCVLEDNKVAKKMYTNAGLTEEGRLRDAVYRSGQYKDYIMMSILRPEYINKNNLHII